MENYQKLARMSEKIEKNCTSSRDILRGNFE